MIDIGGLRLSTLRHGKRPGISFPCHLSRKQPCTGRREKKRENPVPPLLLDFWRPPGKQRSTGAQPPSSSRASPTTAASPPPLEAVRRGRRRARGKGSGLPAPPPRGLPDGNGVASEADSKRQRVPHPLLPVLPRQRHRRVAGTAGSGQAASGDPDLLGRPGQGAILEHQAFPSRVKGLGGGGEKEEVRSDGRSSGKVARERSYRRKRRRRDSPEATSEESSTARSRCRLHLRMDPNQQKATEESQAPYPAAINSSYQGQQMLYGTQGQAYMQGTHGQTFMYGTQAQPFLYGTQAQPFIIGTQGQAYMQGTQGQTFNMPMMHPSANVTQPPQPVEQADGNEDGEPEVEELTTPPARTSKGRRAKVGCRTSNFSNVEDTNLVKSWLEISTDASVGTGQKKERMWERILERFDLRRETSGTPKRSVRSLQSRWDSIKTEVGKFCSSYAQCVRENRSGTTDTDKTTQATTLFGSVNGHNFAFMHCWEIMKDEPKWKDPKCRLSSRSAVGEGFGEDTTNGDEGSVERRPMGRDAAKAAKKKPNSSAGSASAEYASRMQDLCLQQTAIMQADSERKQNHFQQLASLEDQRFQEMQRHNQSLLLIEKEKIDIDKEKMRLMREKQEQDREEKEKQEDERILAIDLDKCRPSQRQYYELLQEEILEKQRARRGKRQTS